MAIVNCVGWPTGLTLTFSVYSSDGETTREADSALTEKPAVGSGLYIGATGSISKGDNVVIKNGATPMGGGEYNGKTMTHDSIKITRNG